MKIITKDKAFDLAYKLLTSANVDSQNSQAVATHLVEAELAGYPSHGLLRLAQYLSEIRLGNVIPNVQPLIVEKGSFIDIDGMWGLGQVTASIATQKAIEIANRIGVAIVTIQRCNHIGRLESYTRHIANQNQIGLMCVNGHGRSARVAAWQGCVPVLHTNPLSIAVPTQSDPLVLDMSTSAVAEGKVKFHYINNLPIPEGWLVDAQGETTTDASVLYQEPPGALLPFGGVSGYKGFGLSLMIDILAGALSGAGTTRSFGSSGHRGNGVFLCVINIAHVRDVGDYLSEVQDFILRIRNNANPTNKINVRLPGDNYFKNRCQKMMEGIAISDRDWERLEQEAKLWDFSIDSLL